MTNIFIPSEQNSLYKRIMSAHYNTSAIPAYSGNPLIEALPEIHPPAFVRSLTHIPEKKGEVLQLSTLLRIHMAASTLEQCFTTTPQMVALEETVSMMIRQGYTIRNPSDSRLSAKPATGLPLCGIHGCGQKTALRVIASTYPSVILHHEYHTDEMPMIQIPCLEVHLSGNSTLLSLFDSISDGISHLIRFPLFDGLNLTKEVRCTVTIRLLRSMHVGILLVYGFDALRSKSSINEILGFLTSLITTASIPVVFVAGPDLAAVFGTHYTFGYPASSAKSIFSFLMDLDASWTEAAGNLWNSMILRSPIPFTDEIAILLHAHSRGLIGIAKRILEEAEIHALQCGFETFTVEELNSSALAAIEHLAFQIDDLVEGSRLASEHLLDLAQAHLGAMHSDPVVEDENNSSFDSSQASPAQSDSSDPSESSNV